MKRVLALVLVMILVFFAVSTAETISEEQRQKNIEAQVQKLKDAGLWDESLDEDTEEDDAWYEEYKKNLGADQAAKDDICMAAIEAILDYQMELYDASLSDVTVNPNMGTDEAGDFIALVYMTYNIMGKPKDDMHMIVRESNTIATALAESCPGVVELAVFWELPEYDSQAKVHYLMGDDGKFDYGDDAMFPSIMVNG